MAGTRPMTVKEIVARAQAFDFNPQIPLKHWLRTAAVLLREARIYEEEGNDQQAYLLLMRYATLVAEYISTLPSRKDPENRAAFRAAAAALPAVLVSLSELKPRIQARHDRWEEAQQQRKDAAAITNGLQSLGLADSDPAIAGNRRTIVGTDHGELAVRLAHQEIRRRDAARRSTRRVGISYEEERERRGGGVWDDPDVGPSNYRQDDESEQRRRMEDLRRRTDGANDTSSRREQKRLSKPDPRLQAAEKSRPMSDYRYPTISKPQPLHYEDSRSRYEYDDSTLPPVPPKERSHRSDPTGQIAPPRPNKASYTDQLAPTRPEKQPTRPEKQPLYDTPSPTTSPVHEASSYTFKPSAYLENGSPLRTLWLPTNIRQKFLSIARPNTLANLETCGILCGTLISNALFVSKLVIPEQESTSDTCETVNESGLFDYCDREDLMVLGWIHTHPSQTCFMSSRDLHTHCGYQVMMPESIAIVCAPSKTPSWGVFRLTDPPGMQTVLNCRQTGLFHPHGEANIYTDALKPGHVYEASGLNFEVVDLRP